MFWAYDDASVMKQSSVSIASHRVRILPSFAKTHGMENWSGILSLGPTSEIQERYVCGETSIPYLNSSNLSSMFSELSVHLFSHSETNHV
jgi:hypothetical protein